MDSLESMINSLRNLLSSKTVIGEPITAGDVTLVPIMDVMFGFGGGSGESRNSGQPGAGSGGGGGGRVAPKALVMIKGGEVSVLPLAKGGTVERILEMVPEVVGKLSQFKGSEKKKEDTAE